MDTRVCAHAAPIAVTISAAKTMPVSKALQPFFDIVSSIEPWDWLSVIYLSLLATVKPGSPRVGSIFRWERTENRSVVSI
jgi:hypothetical protein